MYATGPSLDGKRCKTPYQLGEDSILVQSDAECAARCDQHEDCAAFDTVLRDNGERRCSLCKNLIASWSQFGPDHSKCLNLGQCAPDKVDSQATCEEKAEAAGHHWYHYNDDDRHCETVTECDVRYRLDFTKPPSFAELTSRAGERDPITGTTWNWKIYHWQVGSCVDKEGITDASHSLKHFYKTIDCEVVSTTTTTTTVKQCGPYQKKPEDTCVPGFQYATGPSLDGKRCKTPYQLQEDTVTVQSDRDCAERCEHEEGCVAFDTVLRDSGERRCSLCKNLVASWSQFGPDDRKCLSFGPKEESVSHTVASQVECQEKAEAADHPWYQYDDDARTCETVAECNIRYGLDFKKPPSFAELMSRRTTPVTGTTWNWKIYNFQADSCVDEEGITDASHELKHFYKTLDCEAWLPSTTTTTTTYSKVLVEGCVAYDKHDAVQVSVCGCDADIFPEGQQFKLNDQIVTVTSSVTVPCSGRCGETQCATVNHDNDAINGPYAFGDLVVPQPGEWHCKDNNDEYTSHYYCSSKSQARTRCESAGLRLCSKNQIKDQIGSSCRLMWTSSSNKKGYYVSTGATGCGKAGKLLSNKRSDRGKKKFDAACCMA